MKETKDEQSREALVKYRLDRADETMKEVEILAKESHFNAAVNRLYYACYYAVSALLVANGLNAQSHAGTKTLLGLHFVSSGKFLMIVVKPLAVFLKSDIVVIMMISSIVTKK